MCGIAGIFGPGWEPAQIHRMVAAQHHRGPDAQGVWLDPGGVAALGHNRLSIIDLSEAGRQPMWNHDGTLTIVFNGEIYNYLELRRELSGYPFRSQSDTEVILAAWERWGAGCLDRFLGMFAFLLWDTRQQRLFAVRDRFGVKPLYFHQRPDGVLLAASEIKALHAGGCERSPNPAAWAAYLAHGLYDHGEQTFWNGVSALPPGHLLTWSQGELRSQRWYDLAERTGNALDARPEHQVAEEYLALLKDSVTLRFRSDVPVGINLSGGTDSSTLLGLVQAVQGEDSAVRAFTFVTGDERYDELPWVEQMIGRTRHPLSVCRLDAADVPALAESVQAHQEEPFGGIPTLAYARLFERARAEGVIVLLDGQGMDEQWAGYDYYARVLEGGAPGLVQGTSSRPVRSDCLAPELSQLAGQWQAPRPFNDPLRDLQYRDARFTKIPRALRFNDRVSMRSSTELREPFLDHRLFELALRQPAGRKISNGVRKRMLRDMIGPLLPAGVAEAPKRPLQTPQREWLRGPLQAWAEDCIEDMLAQHAGWFQPAAVRNTWREFLRGESDNSFYVWQWIGLSLAVPAGKHAAL